MELQEICCQVVAGAEGVVGCLLLDMETGLPLAQAAKPGADLPTEQIVADTRRVFRSGLVAQFAGALSPPRDLRGFVEEAQLTTAEAQHFMASVPGWDGALVVLVADRTLRVGIAWMCVRAATQRLADARPAQGERRNPALPTDGSVEQSAAASTPDPDESASAPATPEVAPDAAARAGATPEATAATPGLPEAAEGLQPEPPLLTPDIEPALLTPDDEPPPLAVSPEPPRVDSTSPSGTDRTAPPVDLTEPPRVELTDPPRVGRGRAPSIRARRSIPMDQLLREPESDAQEPTTPPDAASPPSEVGRLGARASLRTRTKRP